MNCMTGKRRLSQIRPSSYKSLKIMKIVWIKSKLSMKRKWRPYSTKIMSFWKLQRLEMNKFSALKLRQHLSRMCIQKSSRISIVRKRKSKKLWKQEDGKFWTLKPRLFRLKIHIQKKSRTIKTRLKRYRMLSKQKKSRFNVSKSRLSHSKSCLIRKVRIVSVSKKIFKAVSK